MKKFKIKDLGSIKSCLGVIRDRKNGKLYLDQQKYTEEIFTKFSMLYCNPVSTPLELGLTSSNKAKGTE